MPTVLCTKDETSDRLNSVRPAAIENFDDDEILLRNLDGLGRNIGNLSPRAYNFIDDLNAKRFYVEHKLNNQPSQSQQHSTNVQHPLKRTIDSIGGANLLKRAVDRIGGGHLLKRR